MIDSDNKKSTGGSNASRGIDFQARVTAIVMANILSEQPTGWMEGVLDDTPKEVDAETAGPGDDVRFITTNGARIELQAKQGLQRGTYLWDALMALAVGIQNGTVEAGILAVCPNASGTIREELSDDIFRLGSGRSDGLRDIGADWLRRLDETALDVSHTCGRIRIVVVSAIPANREAERTATERLRRVLKDPASAFERLVIYSRGLIQWRSKATPESLYRTLKLAGLTFNTDQIQTRVQLQSEVAKWLHDTYSIISIPGIHNRVRFADCWIALDAHVLTRGFAATDDELEKALKRYHESTQQTHASETACHAHSIGRFVNRCVVLGGPGTGKSTLLKRLALEYSGDGYLTLLAKLPQIAALMKTAGARFEDCVLHAALSGSGIHADKIDLAGCVLLCDGLDECGHQQASITSSLNSFAKAHPTARIVITSRPIGFRPGEIADWRHYELQSLRDTQASDAIANVLKALPFPNDSALQAAIAVGKEKLNERSISAIASRNPMMVTLMAALIAKGVTPSNGKAGLYSQLFKLIEDHPPARMMQHPPAKPETARFLELLGWALLIHSNEPAETSLERCAQWWTKEAGTTPLISRVKVGECLKYWECLGIVERVRTFSEEAITFVHKTFGEFAAARYLLNSDAGERPQLLVKVIETREWREVLSFASHLGLASQILEIWTELAQSGDRTTGYTLDEAVELVAQSGTPLTPAATEAFARCCWKLVADNASRARYAAGEALCLVAQEHWQIVRSDVLERLEDRDDWIKLVAWACLCVSPEKHIPFLRLVEIIGALDQLMPSETNLRAIRFSPTGHAVRGHFLVGAVDRVLANGASAEQLAETFKGISFSEGINWSAFRNLAALFKKYDLQMPSQWTKSFETNLDWVFAADAFRVREAIALLDIIDEPGLIVDELPDSDFSRFWELGALLFASQYGAISLSEAMEMSCQPPMAERRRAVTHLFAQLAGLDKKALVRQARIFREKISSSNETERLSLFDLPFVDAVPDCELAPQIAANLATLEEVILEGGEYFRMSAGVALYPLRSSRLYPGTVKRLLTSGRDGALRIAAALAQEVSEMRGQQLILSRLLEGKIIEGCEYLFRSLEPPFEGGHLEAACRGLAGQSAMVARAAAEFALKLTVSVESARKLKTYYMQWITKEEPYPKQSGTIPDSPRDALAKILVQALPDDYELLGDMAVDDRRDVRTTAGEAIVEGMKQHPPLRERIIQAIEEDKAEPSLMRTALSRGAFTQGEAERLLQLLRNEHPRVRYAALPILETNLLSPDRVREECGRLASDVDMDIREAAARILSTPQASSL